MNKDKVWTIRIDKRDWDLLQEVTRVFNINSWGEVFRIALHKFWPNEIEKRKREMAERRKRGDRRTKIGL